MNYFDPIRYAPRQHAPVFTVIGTHDQYFPLPSANLMEQAITSAGTQANFEKRLWLLPNTPHRFGERGGTGPHRVRFAAVAGLCLRKARPASGRASGDAIRRKGRPAVRDHPGGERRAALPGAQATFYAATQVDSSVAPIQDFKAYPAARQGDRFVARIPPGETSGSGDVIQIGNVIFYATVTDGSACRSPL